MELLHKIILLLFCHFEITFEDNGFCTKESDGECSNIGGQKYLPRFLFYDVNFPEGFNLRRDVYMRLAIFMKSLKDKGENWRLVLPPWHKLYHWKSRNNDNSNLLPWKLFFDVESMNRFAPVIELDDFLKETKITHLDMVYCLQHFDGAFITPNWDWADRWSINRCDIKDSCSGESCDPSKKYNRSWFRGLGNISLDSIRCVSFQGPASLLKKVFDSRSSFRHVLVDHAEIVLHDRFGDETYWKCRRSMRFAKHLVNEGNIFRKNALNSSDQSDGTIWPLKWEDEKRTNSTLGGPYICAHLRRADYLFGRSNQIPSIEFAATQIIRVLENYKLNTLFLATDATQKEIKELKDLIEQHKKNLIRYIPNSENISSDGETAIIDQIICSHSRHFIGTHESTFTFRIHEERQILGFPSKSFNVFCAKENKCFKPENWDIVF